MNANLYKMLHSKCSGNGKTIVFIHGCSQSVDTWDKLIQEPLLISYSLLRVYMPGHGQSFWSNDPLPDYLSALYRGWRLDSYPKPIKSGAKGN